MDSRTVNSPSPDLAQVHRADVAENVSAKASYRGAAHSAFSGHPNVTQAGVVMQKPFASSSFETYSSAISTHAKTSLIAEGPSGLVALGSALLSLALLIFFKCKSSGRRGTVQL